MRISIDGSSVEFQDGDGPNAKELACLAIRALLGKGLEEPPHIEPPTTIRRLAEFARDVLALERKERGRNPLYLGAELRDMVEEFERGGPL